MIYRHWLVASGCMTLLLAGCGEADLSHLPATPLSPPDIAQQLQASVVPINYQEKPGHGTGFFVQGLKGVCTVITAGHVVAPSHKLQLQTPDKEIWETSNVQRFDHYDLAVVTFSPPGKSCPYPALRLGNSETVQEGDTIYIRGFPTRSGDLVSQFVDGKVSAIQPQADGYGISYETTTASGMSGGPVVNADGEVIAVHGRTDIELAKLMELKGGELQPQQPSLQGVGVGTFKWGIPIDVYKTNISKIPPLPVVQSRSPKTAEDWLNAGNNLFVAGQYEEAIDAYDQAIALNGRYAEAWYSKGVTQAKLQDYQGAIASFKKAIKLNPDLPQPWTAIGDALFESEKYKDALIFYEKATQFHPNDPEYWYKHGYALRKLKRYDEALTSFDTAIKIKDNYAEAWTEKGVALSNLDRQEDAIASCEQAIQFQPDYAKAWKIKG